MKHGIKKVTIITILLLCGTGILFAGAFENMGLTVLSRQVKQGQISWKIEDRTGDTAEVVTTGEPTRSEAEVVSYVLDLFPRWDYLAVKSIRVDLTDEVAQILVVPDSFVYEGTDLAKYMPSGMQFYYQKFAEYDFRILVDDLFLRIQGQLYTEEQLCEKLKTAIENPAAYVQSHDPEYVIEQFKQVNAKIEELNQADKNKETEISNLKEEVADLEGELATITKAYNELKMSFDELKMAFDKTRTAMMYFHNSGFLWGPEVVPQEAIDRVVALKTERPELTRGEVAEIVKSEDVKITGRAIELVFRVYFNDFD